jgi:DNA end-binding protein Ku
MRGKAHAVAILADGGLLRAVTLRYSDELRTAEAMGIAAPARVDSSRVAEMKRAIGKLKATEIEESELRDDSTEKLLERAREKLARGADVVSAPEGVDEEMDGETGAEVIDLVDLIRKRMRAAPARAKKSPAKEKEPPLRKIHKVPSRSEGRSSRRRVS